MLAQDGDAANARVVLQQAIDSGDPGVTPMAAYNLGIMLAQQGDFHGARAALELAARSTNPDLAHEATSVLARLPSKS
jgi:Flp pilus assembly protein TadD